MSLTHKYSLSIYAQGRWEVWCRDKHKVRVCTTDKNKVQNHNLIKYFLSIIGGHELALVGRQSTTEESNPGLAL